MKIFKNKSLWIKIGIAILVVLVLAFVLPHCVHAADDDGSGWGGKLLSSLMSLFVAIADGIMSIIQKAITNMDAVLYTITTGKAWWKVGLLIIGTVAAVIAFIATGGTISLILAAAGVILTLSAIGVGGQSNIVFQIASEVNKSMLGDETLYLPAYTLTPYEIFKDEGNLFSVNFFDNTKTVAKVNGAPDNKTLQQKIRPVIANWYVTLRTIALVSMLSVLVYIGIRITISSTAADKAKYKQFLTDWCVGMCLLFLMHYIMAFANIMVDKVTDILSSINVSDSVKDDSGNSYTDVYNGVEGYFIGLNDDKTVNEDTTDLVKSAWKSLVGDDTNSKFKQYFFTESLGHADSEGDAKVLFWPAENFTVQARMNCQIVKNSDGITKYEYVGYALIYVMLVIFTCVFLFVYIKRFIYMAFLTIIAPLVALTYPIDKIKDGRAQGFDFWFKEYIYNLLLQPLHLLLYMILIGSAMQFASSNPIYVIVCLGFFVPAEKLLRSMFDFKGQTPGSMPGMAAGALMMNGVNKLLGRGPKGVPNKGGNPSGGSSGNKEESPKIKTKSSDPYGDQNLFGDSNNISNSSENSNVPFVEEGNKNDEATPQRQMLDAYDEKFGTDDWDPQERETLAREANSEPEGMHYSDEEYRNILRDSGYSEEEIRDEMGENKETTDASGVFDNKPITNTSESPEKNGRMKHITNAIRGAAGNYNIGRINRRNQRLKALPGRALRATSRLASGAIGAGFGMAAAGLAGIATGDPSKAAQYMTLGAMSGYKMTSRIPENIANSVGVPGTIEAAKKGYYKDDFEGLQQAEIKKSEKNFRMDTQGMQRLQNNLTTEQYKELVKKDGENNALNDYISHGIKSPNEIIQCEKFADSQNVSRESAMNILSLSKQVGDVDSMSSKNQADWEKTMAQNFMKKTGIKDENDHEIKNRVSQARKYLTAMDKCGKNIV